MSAVIARSVAFAWSSSRIKSLTYDLNMSWATARRLIQGHLPARRREQVLDELDARLAQRIEEAISLRDELRKVRHAATATGHSGSNRDHAGAHRRGDLARGSVVQPEGPG